MKKYFEILELDVSASIEEVEQAYKELAETWRPENYQNLPRFKRKAEIKLKEINDAYELIRSYLQVKASGAGQMVFDLPANLPPEPEPETAATEGAEPQQTRTSSPKKAWMMVLITAGAVLGSLVLYLISNQSKTTTTGPQPIAAEKEKSAQDIDNASQPVAVDHLKKKSKLDSAEKFSTEKHKRPDYDGLLTQEALSRYNRDPVRVKRIQNGLITVGYNPGPIDGVIGPQTTEALKQFARDRGHLIAGSDFYASDLADGLLVFGEVSAKHPDWDRIISSEDFTRWIDNHAFISANQIKKLKKSATARQIIEMLDLYKSDKKTP